jgi:Fe-S cluster assembly protein SufD
MIVADTYQINPEWAALAKPLIHRLDHQNGARDILLQQLHQSGLTQFQNVPVPGRKNEDCKYTPLRELVSQNYEQAPKLEGGTSQYQDLINAIDATCIVFVNGHLIPALSGSLPEGLTIGPVTELTKDAQYENQLKEVIELLDKSRMTPFEALVTSSTSNGFLIQIAPKAKLQKPLHVIHLMDNTGPNPIASYPYKLILVGAQAEATLVESFIGRGAQVSLTNSVNHVKVERNAHFHHYRLQAENLESFHVNATRVFQDTDSTYTSLAVEIGGKLARNNIEVLHQGSNVLSNLFGIFVGNGRQHLDTQSFIDHAVPHCESHELYKGILDEHARGVFNGKILVREDAQKTNAFQQNNTLVLSRQAIMDSKPQLEIFADDVKCSHGATIGQLDESALFYLRSRGLTRQEASTLLQRAFIGEVLDKCPDESIKEYLWQHVAAKSHV